MYCSNCGGKLKAGDLFCSNCGQKLDKDPVPTGIVDEGAPSRQIITKDSKAGEHGQLTKEQIQIIESPSWGSLLGLIYLIAMQSWVHVLILVVLSLFSWVMAGVPTLVFFVYLIVKAKSIAWKSRKWESFDQFLGVQRAWDLWAKIILALNILIFALFMIIFAMAAVVEYQESPSPSNNPINNIPAYDNINSI